jgi:hypothetical protein
VPVVATGSEALIRARALLPTAFPVRGETNIGQRYDIAPGTIDRNGTIIIGLAYNSVVELKGVELHSTLKHTWLHNYQILDVTGRVRERTRWIEPAAKIVMAFSMGIAAGAFGAAATVASIGVFVTKIGVFYTNHEDQCDMAIAELGTAIEVLDWIKRHCPKTWELLGRIGQEAVWQALVSVPQGLDASDAAATFGRFLGGLSAAPQAGLGPLLRILASTVGTFVGRLPAAAARGAVARAESAAQDLIETLREQRIPVTPAEAQVVMLEFRQNPAVVPKLAELKAALERAAPVLQRLAAAFRAEDAPR